MPRGWLDDWDFVTRWWQTRESRRLDSDCDARPLVGVCRGTWRSCVTQACTRPAEPCWPVPCRPTMPPLAFDRGIALCLHRRTPRRHRAFAFRRAGAPAGRRAIHHLGQIRPRRAAPGDPGRRAGRGVGSIATDERGQMGGLRRQLDRQARRHERAGAAGQLRRTHHPDHAVHADEPGIGGALLPAARSGCSTSWCSTRHRRSGWPTRSARWAVRGRWSSSATASRCRRPASPRSARHRRGRGVLAPRVVVDEESILTECVQAQVPSKWLSWHYRSQDEALIAFSNTNYYDSRLSSFPAPLDAVGDADRRSRGVAGPRRRALRPGRKGRTLRTNPVEAERDRRRHPAAVRRRRRTGRRRSGSSRSTRSSGT